MNLNNKELMMCFKLKQTTNKTFKSLVSEYKADIQEYLDEGGKFKVDVITPQKQEVSELKEVVGVYYGKTIVTDGEKKDGVKWILYKVQIKIDAVDKPLNFSAFDNVKGLSELMEGKKFTVKYKEEDKVNKAGQQYKAKTAIQFVPEFVSDDLE